MKHFFLSLCNDNRYRANTEMQTRNLPLENLFYYISSQGQDNWIRVEEDRNDP